MASARFAAHDAMCVVQVRARRGARSTRRRWCRQAGDRSCQVRPARLFGAALILALALCAAIGEMVLLLSPEGEKDALPVSAVCV